MHFSVLSYVLLTVAIIPLIAACPCGSYLPKVGEPESDIKLCPAGTYSLADKTACTACVPASSCPTSGMCAPITYKCGNYSTESPPYQKPCRSGYYCPPGATPNTPITPVKCPGGYYCGAGTCNPLPCPCGYKCPAGSSAPIASQPPYYIPHNRSTGQTLCPIGYKCSRPALCNATLCLNGTYVTCAGKKTCDPCPAGRYCPTPTRSVLCPAGSYCAGGASAPTPCQANNYCPLGSSKSVACPLGKISPAGSKSKYQCTI